MLARPRTVCRLCRRIENITEALDRQARLMEVLPQLGQAQHRGAAHASCQHVEGDEFAFQQLGTAVDDKPRADVEDHGGHKLADQLHDLPRRVAETGPRGSLHSHIRRAAASQLRCIRGSTAIAFRKASPFPLRSPPEMLDFPCCGETSGQADHGTTQLPWLKSPYRMERRPARSRVSGAEYTNTAAMKHNGRRESINYERQCRAGKKIADVFKLTHARDRIANPPGLKVGDGQGREMSEQMRAEFHVDAVRRVREKIGPQNSQPGLENGDRDEPEDENVKSGHAAMHEHLIDDDLKEERRNEGKELQKERGDQDLASRLRYFWIAPRNHLMPKRCVRSVKLARLVIRISSPSQIAKSSARVIKTGRGACGDCTRTLSSDALAITMNPPSRSAAMAGKGVFTSRDQPVRQARALSPRSLAHRSISGAPIFADPSLCLICSRSAATPCKCRSVTRDFKPRIGRCRAGF